MVDSITPTQPLTPSLPVTVPPDDKRREQQKKSPEDNDNEPHKDIEEKHPKGLFDEYI